MSIEKRTEEIDNKVTIFNSWLWNGLRGVTSFVFVVVIAAWLLQFMVVTVWDVLKSLGWV